MSRTSKTHSSKFTPSLESLETRSMFTTTIGVTSDGIMNIRGDNGDNNIAIVDNGDGDLTVVADGVTTVARNVRIINLAGNRGNDIVSYHQDGNRTRSMKIHANLNDGHDQFFGTINGNVNWGRTLDVAVAGHDGNDRISFRATNDVDVRSGGVLRTTLSGGDGHDQIFANYRGELDGRLEWLLTGGDDNDTLSALVRADRGSSGQVTSQNGRDSRVEGNDGNDSLRFEVRKESFDRLRVAAVMDGGDRDWFWESDKDTGVRTSNVRSVEVERNFVV